MAEMDRRGLIFGAAAAAGAMAAGLDVNFTKAATYTGEQATAFNLPEDLFDAVDSVELSYPTDSVAGLSSANAAGATERSDRDTFTVEIAKRFAEQGIPTNGKTFKQIKSAIKAGPAGTPTSFVVKMPEGKPYEDNGVKVLETRWTITKENDDTFTASVQLFGTTPKKPKEGVFATVTVRSH